MQKQKFWKEFALKELDSATTRALIMANVDEKAPKRAGGTGGLEFPFPAGGAGAGIEGISETSFETIEKLVAKLKL